MLKHSHDDETNADTRYVGRMLWLGCLVFTFSRGHIFRIAIFFVRVRWTLGMICGIFHAFDRCRLDRLVGIG